jgi:hypothetical protein
MTDPIRGIFRKLVTAVAARRRLSAFNCGDCARSDQCGLPPSDDCVVRLVQIARGDDWKARRRAKFLTGW